MSATTMDSYSRSLLPTVIGAVNSVARTAHSNPEMNAVLRSVASAFAMSTGVSRCSISLPDDDSGYFHIGLSLGRTDYTARARAMVDGTDPLSNEILTRRAPVVVNDSLTDPLVRKWEPASRALGVFSMLGIPLTFDDDVVGLAFLDTEHEQAKFSAWQIEAASQLGALCGAPLAMTMTLGKQMESLQRARSENATLRRLIRLDRLLEDLVAAGMSPATFAGNAARLLGRPVSVHDRNWRKVAHGYPDGTEHCRLVDFSDRRIQAHPRIRKDLDRLRDQRETRTIAALPALDIHHRCIVAPIELGAERWGHIVVHEIARPFQPFENDVVYRVGARFGAAVAATNDKAATVAELRGSVLRALLADNTDTAALTDRADVAGLTTGAEHLLMLFSTASPAGLTPEDVRNLTALAGSALGGGNILTSVRHRDVVVFADAPKSDLRALRDELARLLAERHCPLDISAVVSERFTHVTDTHDRYAECQQAMRCAQRFRHPQLPRAVLVGDFGPALPFVASVDVDEARAYARRNLKGLDGSVGEDDLFVTARVFLESTNVRRAAKTLGVHENTIRYRLARIEKLTGLDLLNKTTDQLKAELSIAALRLVGDMPWDRPGE
ncbi:GAF domain-containing protein [Nocardia sp. R6R-6]|uniref:GAF domain-containing protein n=1 Tax=Nocardia sp. R6R-6 TaxID=3459303 RepID=UPI00403DFC82